MIEKDFRDMEDVMAKTSLENEKLAYRLKKFYDECKSRYMKKRESDYKAKQAYLKRQEAKEKRQKAIARDKRAEQLQQYKSIFKKT